MSFSQAQPDLLSGFLCRPPERLQWRDAFLFNFSDNHAIILALLRIPILNQSPDDKSAGYKTASDESDFEVDLYAPLCASLAPQPPNLGGFRGGQFSSKADVDGDPRP